MREGSYWDGWWRRQVSRRRVLRETALGGVGLAGLALVGCGDGGGTQASGTPRGDEEAGEPQRGGVIVYPNLGDAPHLDVHRSATTFLLALGPGVVYSQLVQPRSVGNEGSLIAEPDLAESWENPEPTVYVFKLRGNARFHDIPPVNGRPATAEDVKYSFERQMAEKVNASALAGLRSIEAVDPQTVRLELDEPNVDFLPGLADKFNKVIAREVVEERGDLEEGPSIGTGPWILREWQRGTGITFDRNPDYFIPGLPYADELRLVLITDPANLLSQFQGGGLTFVGATRGIGLRTARDLVAQGRAKVHEVQPRGGSQWIFVNQRRPQYRDLRVRRALSQAIDRQLIIQTVLEGEGYLNAATVNLPGPDWLLPQEELAEALGQDLEEARRLLEEAGGLPDEELPVYEDPTTVAMAQVIQANWREIGFNVTIRPIDNVELTGSIFNPAVADYGVSLSSSGHSATTTADLENYYKTGGARNSMGLSDAELDRLIQQQKAEFDEERRRELINEIQRRVLETVATIPLPYPPEVTLYQPNAHNVEPPPIPGWPGNFFAQVWFKS